MSETIPSDIERYVEHKVASGQFASREEFTLEAIRVYRELETRHAELRQEIGRRIELADDGHVAPWDIEEIKAEGKRRLSQQPGNQRCQE